MVDILQSLTSTGTFPMWLLIIVLAWSLVWKGLALWKAARASHKLWFIAILLINTVGILEILYLYVFSKLQLEEKKKSKRR